MARLERLRDILSGMPESDYFERKSSQGWKLVAVEWERNLDDREDEYPRGEEVPYGTKIAADCLHLVENPAEMEVLTVMIEQLLADKSLSAVARGLNDRGFRTRTGAPWNSVGVFEMLPRVIEVAPRIYPTQDWSVRRRKIFSIGI